MKYYGIIQKRKLWIKITAIILGSYLLYNLIMNKEWLYVPFAMIIILATFSNRSHVISEEGVDILYTIFGKEFHNIWDWNDINTMHTDSIKLRPNVELHIGKGVISRRFIYTFDETKEIIKISKKMNCEIYIAELDHR